MMVFWCVMMCALLWSVFYRSAIASATTKFSIRLGLTGTAAGALVGLAAPLYGWEPDAVTTVIVLSIVNMQVSFARFWRKGVPEQYIAPRHRAATRRATDVEDWA